MALNANALTTLDDLKSYLNITTSDHDSLLEEIINAVSQFIEDYCHRYFISAEREEYYSGDDMKYLSLKAYPITNVDTLQINETTISERTSTSGSGYVIIADKGLIYYSGGFTEGIKNIYVKYTGGYTTIPTDLELACWDICGIIWTYRTKGDLKYEKMGDYAYARPVEKVRLLAPSKALMGVEIAKISTNEMVNKTLEMYKRKWYHV